MHPHVHTPRILALAVCSALGLLPALATAQQPELSPPEAADRHQQTPHQLEGVVVRASPIKQTAADLARPVEVLAGQKLDEAKSATLGRSLEGLPGIQSTGFGPGVGRPVIRGLDGPRVQVVADGMGSGDVSTLSADHAISIEPFLADQIEVLKGPATLLYGSGAIGGAVNVIDGRAPDALKEDPFSGRVELRAGSHDRERTGMFRLDGSTHATGSGLVFHADGLIRDNDDIRIPGHAESAAHLAEIGETPDPATRGRLPNSAVRTRSGALGVSWIGARGHLGVGSSRYETRYGVPGHAQAHAHGAPAQAPAAADEAGVRIDLKQRRHELYGGADDLGIFRTLRFKYARTGYTHTEFEGSQPGTMFDNRSRETRLELVHAPVAGWQGAFGVQQGRRDFEAIGDEAFVPSTRGRDLGLFWMGERRFGALKLELGARHDRSRIDTVPQPLLPDRASRRDFRTHHLSTALRWDLDGSFDLRLGLDRAQRAPGAEALFSNGLHVATGHVEIGDDRLRPETAQRAEVGLGWRSERFRFNAAAYATRYRDFLLLAPLLARTAQGEWETVKDDDIPVQVWTQGDARFHGLELEARFTAFESAAGHLDLRAFGDVVRARLAGKRIRAAEVQVIHGNHVELLQGELVLQGNLPRLAPARLGAELRWEAPAWRASLSGTRSFRQSRTAAGESATPGYTWVDAHFAWHGDTAAGNAWEVFVDGRNLLNQEARQHTSYLKDVAPLPGRGFVGGVRFFF